MKQAQFFYMDRFICLVVGGKVLLYEFTLAPEAADDLASLKKRHHFREVRSLRLPLCLRLCLCLCLCRLSVRPSVSLSLSLSRTHTHTLARTHALSRSPCPSLCHPTPLKEHTAHHSRELAAMPSQAQRLRALLASPASPPP